MAAVGDAGTSGAFWQPWSITIQQNESKEPPSKSNFADFKQFIIIKMGL